MRFHRIILSSVGSLVRSGRSTVSFTTRFCCVTRGIGSTRRCVGLGSLSRSLSTGCSLSKGHVFCLTVSPRFFNAVSRGLGRRGLLARSKFGHLVVRGPFKQSFRSTSTLGAGLHGSFSRGRVFHVSRCLNGRVIRGVSTIHFSGVVFRSL